MDETVSIWEDRYGPAYKRACTKATFPFAPFFHFLCHSSFIFSNFHNKNFLFFPSPFYFLSWFLPFFFLTLMINDSSFWFLPFFQRFWFFLFKTLKIVQPKLFSSLLWLLIVIFQKSKNEKLIQSIIKNNLGLEITCKENWIGVVQEHKTLKIVM